MSKKSEDLLRFQNRLQSQKTITDLEFFVSSEIFSIIEIDKAFFLSKGFAGGFLIKASNNVSSFDASGPYIKALQREASKFLNSFGLNEVFCCETKVFFSDEKLPPFCIWIPIFSYNTGVNVDNGLIIFRQTDFSDNDKKILRYLAKSISHTIAALQVVRSFRSTFFTNSKYKIIAYSVVLLIVMLGFYPVKMSAKADVKIVPNGAVVISAPYDGMIDKIYVTGGQRVSKFEPLFSFKLVELKAELSLAKSRQKLAVTSMQQAINSRLSDGAVNQDFDWNKLNAELDLANLDVELLQLRIDHGTVYSDREGVVLLDGSLDFSATPIRTGTKILEIINPQETEIEIEVSVNNMIPVSVNDEVSFILFDNPIKTLSAKVEQIDYMPIVNNRGVLVYRLVAQVVDNDEILKVGSIGSARVHGPPTFYFYQLFRKPIISLRQFLG